MSYCKLVSYGGLHIKAWQGELRYNDNSRSPVKIRTCELRLLSPICEENRYNQWIKCI